MPLSKLRGRRRINPLFEKKKEKTVTIGKKLTIMEQHMKPA